MMPKSKEQASNCLGSSEIVDVAGIDTRIVTLPREVSRCRVHQREVSRGHSSCRKRADIDNRRTHKAMKD